MGDALLLFNISRPQRLTELSNVTQMASRTLAGNSQCSGCGRNRYRRSECAAGSPRGWRYVVHSSRRMRILRGSRSLPKVLQMKRRAEHALQKRLESRLQGVNLLVTLTS